MKRFLSVVLAVLITTACGESGPDTTGPDKPDPGFDPGSAVPADPVLAELYNRSCRSCHATGASQAPLTTDRQAWEPRLEQGMELLLDHTINGYQGMPPMGMCFDCDEAQFEGLIRFMSGVQ